MKYTCFQDARPDGLVELQRQAHPADPVRVEDPRLGSYHQLVLPGFEDPLEVVVVLPSHVSVYPGICEKHQTTRGDTGGIL